MNAEKKVQVFFYILENHTDRDYSAESPADIQMLAAEAAGQMTARFNPRRFDASSAVALYETAL